MWRQSLSQPTAATAVAKRSWRNRRSLYSGAALGVDTRLHGTAVQPRDHLKKEKVEEERKENVNYRDTMISDGILCKVAMIVRWCVRYKQDKENF